MTTLIERMARAHYEELYPRGKPPQHPAFSEDQWIAAMRAALLAAREPTEGMLIATIVAQANHLDALEAAGRLTRESHLPVNVYALNGEFVTIGFMAAIDAALAEGGEHGT